MPAQRQRTAEEFVFPSGRRFTAWLEDVAPWAPEGWIGRLPDAVMPGRPVKGKSRWVGGKRSGDFGWCFFEAIEWQRSKEINMNQLIPILDTSTGSGHILALPAFWGSQSGSQ